jgi:DNA primase
VSSPPRGKARETIYEYPGHVKHHRLDFPDKTKRMWWEPGGIKMSDLPLWNGDLLRESRFDNEPVLLVEGEKDANRGVEFGFCAVSLPGGASQRDFGDALVPLRDRDVVLIPDSDQPGSLLMKYVAAALTVVGVARIRVLQMLPSDHDLSDLLNADADADPRGAQAALLAMIDAADTLWP